MSMNVHHLFFKLFFLLMDDCTHTSVLFTSHFMSDFIIINLSICPFLYLLFIVPFHTLPVCVCAERYSEDSDRDEDECSPFSSLDPQLDSVDSQNVGYSSVQCPIKSIQILKISLQTLIEALGLQHF